MLKWEVYRIWCDHIPNPHDKFCICICPNRHWFLFINSQPPMFRKARALAVSLSSQEALFLTHDSFIDTTALQTDISPEMVRAATNEAERNHGFLAPFLQRRIADAVASHEVMEPLYREAVLSGR